MAEKENAPPEDSPPGLGPTGGLPGPVPTPRGRKRTAEHCVSDIFSWGPIKKHARVVDPLTHHGRHFGRTVRTFCRVSRLIEIGLQRALQIESGRIDEDDLTDSESKEYEIYRALMSLLPGLEEKLWDASVQETQYAAQMIAKGVASARSDDTKSLKLVIVDWIAPIGGLNPPIQRNIKTDRGFNHEATGVLLCPVNMNWGDPLIRRDLKAGTLIPSGDMWPRFIFRNGTYKPDDPWDGLFRNKLLVSAYKHVFTSPSSVGTSTQASRATRSSNAALHGMTAVTIPSIAYISTQLRFALCSSSTFSRTDTETDSEYFYNLVVDLLEDPEEQAEVRELLAWWNLQIFPSYQLDVRTVHHDSVYANIKGKRRLQTQSHSGDLPPQQQSQGEEPNQDQQQNMPPPAQHQHGMPSSPIQQRQGALNQQRDGMLGPPQQQQYPLQQQQQYFIPPAEIGALPQQPGGRASQRRSQAGINPSPPMMGPPRPPLPLRPTRANPRGGGPQR